MPEEPEGATPLGPDEMAGLKFRHITTRGELDELEQANIIEGLQWLGRNQNRHQILQQDFIRTLHRRLFGGVWTWAGKFRQREMNIGIDPAQIAIQLQILLDNANYWTNKSVFSPLEAAARFHHRMVEIHLFPNGNGRHARIATDAFLSSHFNHPPVDWAGGFDLQNSNQRRIAYIAALRQADAGYFAPLLDFVGAE